jgi:hypothetical protein
MTVGVTELKGAEVSALPAPRADISDAVLDRRVDDLLLHARGLALVREVLAGRGASRDELDAHTRELERVRRQLIETLSAVSG